MKNKSIIMFVVFVLLITSVVATERPVRGWVKYSNGTGINNAKVDLHIKLFAHLSSDFWCYCDAPISYSATSGEWVENLNNLYYVGSCLLTGKNINDYCGNDWQDNSEIWANSTGSTAFPPANDGYTSPKVISNVTLRFGVNYLDNITINLDNTPPIIDLILPENQTQYNETNTINFIYNASDDSTINNCTWYINSVSSGSSSIILNSQNNTFQETLSNGNYSWNVSCIDDSLNIGYSNTSYFTIDVPHIPPVITDVINTSITVDSALILINISLDANLTLLWNNSIVMGNVFNNITNATHFSVSLTGLDQGTTYWYNITVCDELNYCDTEGLYNFTTLDDTPPIIHDVHVRPHSAMVIINNTINLTANTTDNIKVDKEWIVITFPNGTTVPINDGINFTTSALGLHNYTVYANDTSNNQAIPYYGFFLVGNVKITQQYNLVNETEGLLGRVEIYYEDGSLLHMHDFVGHKTDPHLQDHLYTYEYIPTDGIVRIFVNKINISIDNNQTIGYYKFNTPLSGDIVTMGLNTTYSTAQSYTVYFNYSGSNFTNEDNLEVFKCSNWNFVNRSCIDDVWVQITSSLVQNKTEDYFMFTVNSFSGFAIREITPVVPPTVCVGCGGGGGGSTKPKPPVIIPIINNTCYHNWDCSSWGPCLNGLSKRDCVYIGTCLDFDNVPDMQIECALEISDLDLIIKEIPEFNFNTESFTVKAAVKNTGDLVLNNINVKLDSDSMFSMNDILIDKLEPAEEYPIDLVLENDFCKKTVIFTDIANLNFIAQSGNLIDTEFIGNNLTIPEFALFTDANHYVEDDVMTLCLVANSKAPKDQVEFEINVLKDSDYIIDYLSSYSIDSNSVLVVKKNYRLSSIPENAEYVVKAKMFDGGKLFEEGYQSSTANKSVTMDSLNDNNVRLKESEYYGISYARDFYKLTLNRLSDYDIDINLVDDTMISLYEYANIDLNSDGQDDVSIQYVGRDGDSAVLNVKSAKEYQELDVEAFLIKFNGESEKQVRIQSPMQIAVDFMSFLLYGGLIFLVFIAFMVVLRVHYPKE